MSNLNATRLESDDNLINSKNEVLDKLSAITGVKPSFYQIDVTDEARVKEIFNNQKIDGLIDFTGIKVVGESVSKPIDYYYNNLVSRTVLSKICVKYDVSKFVFSSSATVYGDQP
jgi:UDP-glucose 4-epimerase